MSIVVFEVRRRSLNYTWFEHCRDEKSAPVSESLVGSVDRVQVHSARAALSLMKDHARAALEGGGGTAVAVAGDESVPAILAFRVPFGGGEFRGPVVVNDDVLRKLDELTVYAPLHLPGIVALMRGCRQAYPSAKQVAVFETSFFAALPAREHLYAVDAAITRSLQLRRYGYHGILHEAACREAGKGAKAGTRLLSICLEPRPEIAAVAEGRPVMVTGGATPLEGLPGEKACGDIDPGIILTLSQSEGLGLEQINQMLTQESGLLGLTGEPANLPAIFADESPRYKLAREFMLYRMLLSCGAAKAAMGGVDRMVFSGRYNAVGEVLGPWLASRLANRVKNITPTWSCFAQERAQIIAESALRIAGG